MSKSRWGGFFKGRKRYLENWDVLESTSSVGVEAPSDPTVFDYTTAQGIWDLNSTVQFKKNNSGGGGSGGGGALSFSFVDSSTSLSAGTVTIPVTAQAGDLAVIFDSIVGSPALPSGWTQVYQENATFDTTISYKLIQAGEPGTSVTGQNSSLTYSIKTMLVFRPSTTLTTVTPSSVNSSGMITTTPPSQAITVTTAPAIVFGMTRAYQAEPFVNETFWSPSEIYGTFNSNHMKVFYEIQNSTPTSRTITASADYGSYNFAMGFTINAS